MFREQLGLLEAALEAAQGRMGELELALVAAQSRIAELGAENATLRERLGQNSSNSSRPPSTDLPREKRQSDRRLTAAVGDQVVVVRLPAAFAPGPRVVATVAIGSPTTRYGSSGRL